MKSSIPGAIQKLSLTSYKMDVINAESSSTVAQWVVSDALGLRPALYRSLLFWTLPFGESIGTG